MSNPTLGKESALFAKWKADLADWEKKVAIADQEDWEKNKDTYIAKGYTRTPDATKTWGGTWSFKDPKLQGDTGGKEEKTEKKAGAGAGDSTTVNVAGSGEKDNTPKFMFNGDKSYWSENSFKSAFNNQFINYLHNIGADLSPYQTTLPGAYNSELKDEQGNPITKLDVTKHPEYQNYLSEAEKLYSKSNSWFKDSYVRLKQGGTMNKVQYFAQGGQPQTQNDIQRQVEALVEDAMAGDQKATQQVNQIMEAAKAGDQKAVQLAQMIQTAAQKIQGKATMNKWGSKLQYMRSLKYAKGGKHTCPACMSKGGSADENVKVAKKDVDAKTYQKQSLAKKIELDEHRLATETSSNKNGSYNTSHKPSAKDSTEIKRHTMSEDMNKVYPKVKSKACGGSASKAKKHYFGGWL